MDTAAQHVHIKYNTGTGTAVCYSVFCFNSFTRFLYYHDLVSLPTIIVQLALQHLNSVHAKTAGMYLLHNRYEPGIVFRRIVLQLVPVLYFVMDSFSNPSGSVVLLYCCHSHKKNVFACTCSLLCVFLFGYVRMI